MAANDPQRTSAHLVVAASDRRLSETTPQSQNCHERRSKRVPIHLILLTLSYGWSLRMRGPFFVGPVFLQIVVGAGFFAQTPASQPHNVVLFIADGLRSRLVDDTPAPQLTALA